MKYTQDTSLCQKKHTSPFRSNTRTVLLPAEVEVEEAQAQEKHGLLTIRLPKIDKEKQTKLKVKAS